MKKQIDQNAAGLRNKALLELVGHTLAGLIARHPKGKIDPETVAVDAVNIAKATTRKLMLEHLL